MNKMEREELREVWRGRVAAFRASGQTGKGWCAANNLRPNQLCYWMKKLKDEEAAKAPGGAEPPGSTKWLPLEINEQPENTESRLLIKVGQAAIEVQAGFDPALLAEVVKTLSLC